MKTILSILLGISIGVFFGIIVARKNASVSCDHSFGKWSKAEKHQGLNHDYDQFRTCTKCGFAEVRGF